MAIVGLEGLGRLKKSNDLIGNRTLDLPACSIVPQFRSSSARNALVATTTQFIVTSVAITPNCLVTRVAGGV
jgi:hypothetical protein